MNIHRYKVNVLQVLVALALILLVVGAALADISSL